MEYHFTTTTNKPVDESIEQLTGLLQQNGFSVVSRIDMHEKFKKKLDVDFRKYVILGACSPKHAYAAVQEEDKIGVFLPCNFVVQDKSNGTTEISAVDPIASMQAVQNPALGETAKEIQEKIRGVIEAIQSD